MSGLVKGVKKVFKKVTNFVKKYWKPIVAAVAIYFTAGVALSYFPSTAGFASSMPGFGTGGMFTKAATWMGFNGSASVKSGLSLASGTYGGAGVSAGSLAASGEFVAPLASNIGTPGAGGSMAGVFGADPNALASLGWGGSVAGAPGAVTPLATPQVLAQTGTQAAAQGGLTAVEEALIKSLNASTKLGIASTVLKTLGGLTKESESDIYEDRHNLQWASSFGVDRSGNDQHGWSNVDQGGAFANMNKRQPQYGYGQGGQGSSFASSPFLPTPFETGGSPMAPPAQSRGGDFIQRPSAPNYA
jgi:hypothetical protein